MKTIFTCPFTPPLLNDLYHLTSKAPTTFQKCMLNIFGDLVERFLEVFIDDIIIFRQFFQAMFLKFATRFGEM